jgi:hypothetical protein
MFRLRDAQKSRLVRDVAAILRTSGNPSIICDGVRVVEPNDLVRALEQSPHLDDSSAEVIVSHLGGIADTLRMSEIQPPRLSIAWLRVDTSPDSSFYVDFEWIREDGARIPSAALDSAARGPGQYPHPCLPGESLALIARFGRKIPWIKGAAWITAPGDIRYNCMAWTLGITDTPVWPTPGIEPGYVPIADLDALYEKYGIVRDSFGHIAAWGLSDDRMAHVALFSYPTGKWESKLGRQLRALHLVPSVPGGSYGALRHYYRFIIGPQQVRESYARARDVAERRYRLTTSEERSLEHLIARTDSDVSRAFDRSFEAWKTALVDQADAGSSDPYSSTQAPEFSALVGLGQAIVPLLMSKMSRGDSYALLAAERLVSPGLWVRREPGDPEELGEAIRAKENCKKWARANG